MWRNEVKHIRMNEVLGDSNYVVIASDTHTDSPRVCNYVRQTVSTPRGAEAAGCVCRPVVLMCGGVCDDVGSWRRRVLQRLRNVAPTRCGIVPRHQLTDVPVSSLTLTLSFPTGGELQLSC